MVDGLFQSLREEASSILLFLNSVYCIEIYERNGRGSIECVFKTEIANDRLAEVQSKRQQLLRQASESSDAESKCVIDVQVRINRRTQNFQWLVLNHIGSIMTRVRKLADELRLLPWIGFAVPLNDPSIDAGAGRIFYFLPLPADIDCETGLPVHVHGYFGFTDDRRGLAWPGPDCQNNEMAEWNKLLLTKVVSAVYCKILQALVLNEPDISIDQDRRAELVYYTLPVLSNVRGHWSSILQPLFEQLVNQNVFYATGVFENSWITLARGVLDRLQQSDDETTEVRNVIMRILVPYWSHPVVITNVPDHVLQIIDRYFNNASEVTPRLVRSVLKRHDISSMSREDKLLLLDYVISDERRPDLSRIPLLPLANGQFIPFQPHNHVLNPATSVFVSHGNCTVKLLPNMSSRFLDENIEEKVKSKLSDMASTRIETKQSTQLVLLTKEIVVENLRSSLPLEWVNFPDQEKVCWTPGRSRHPPEPWLETIWEWIYSSFRRELEPFEGLPLVPLSMTSQRVLGILSRRSKFIFASDAYESGLPTPIINFLTSCGCTVISDRQPYLHHPDISSYIAPPTPAGVLKVLGVVDVKTVEEQMVQRTTSRDRTALRAFMSRIPAITDEQEGLLDQLPLFDTIHGTYTAAQVQGQRLVAVSSNYSFLSRFRFLQGDMIISYNDPSTLQLLSLMKVKILNPAKTCVLYLLLLLFLLFFLLLLHILL